MSSWKSADGVRHPGVVRYLCRSGYLNVAHGRCQVNEKRILEWAKATLEAADLPVRFAQSTGGTSPAMEMAAIEAKRKRILENYEDGLIDKARRDARLAPLKMAEEKIERGGMIFAGLTETFDWSRDPGLVNADLRKMWQRVDLGPDLLPVRVLWWPTERWDELGPLPF